MKTRNNNKSYDLVFDVETTGLPPSKISIFSPKTNNREYESLAKDARALEPFPIHYKNICEALEQYPYITQLSWVLLESKTHTIVQSYNEYIRLPEHVSIPTFIEELTGVTNEKCKTLGVSIVDALIEFSNVFFRTNTIVAHNIDFDRTLIRTEVERNLDVLKKHVPFIRSMFHPLYDTLLNVHQYDTMIRTIKICQIYIETTKGNKKLKPPKLLELYQILFHETPINMHNSMVDTLVCMRCYLKVRYHWHFNDTEFNQLLKNYGSEIINKYQCPSFHFISKVIKTD
jgi:DNA polymerase III epsilon subunit-like protein